MNATNARRVVRHVDQDGAMHAGWMSTSGIMNLNHLVIAGVSRRVV